MKTNLKRAGTDPVLPFDSVALCLRDRRCVVASVAPPFRVAYWGDVEALVAELALGAPSSAALETEEGRRAFLTALAHGAQMEQVFGPAHIGFESSPAELREREMLRRTHRHVIFVGACAREVVLGALELIADQVPQGGTINVQFKQWDALADWPSGRERLSEVCDYLCQTRQLRSEVTVCSKLQDVPPGLWEFVYWHPRVRIAWLAAELAAFGDKEELPACRQRSAALRSLREISSPGLWPLVILPVTAANVGRLAELVMMLLEATRGASVELVPAPLLGIADTFDGRPEEWGELPGAAGLTRREPCGRNSAQATAAVASRGAPDSNLSLGPPGINQSVKALLAIYRNRQAPLRLVSPLSWVAGRVDSEAPLPASPRALGIELAVLPNGDLYAGEWAIGLERWRLGNVLQGAGDMAWERLDLVPEVLSNSLKPAQCHGCEWRYRCGGMDTPAMLTARPDSHSDAEASQFAFYCAPRKRLFEEILWDYAEGGAQGQTRGPRERIELREDGLDFIPMPQPANPSIH